MSLEVSVLIPLLKNFKKGGGEKQENFSINPPVKAVTTGVPSSVYHLLVNPSTDAQPMPP